jgi:hypothetical protein
MGATLRELMERMGHRSTRAALIYLHARDHRDRAIADGLDTIVGTAGLGGQPTVSDRDEGHAEGTEHRQSSAKRPQSTGSKPSTSKNARSGRPGSNRHGQLGRLRSLRRQGPLSVVRSGHSTPLLTVVDRW